jgi:hypothetical protein
MSGEGEGEEERGFKVVDRRRFNMVGDAREGPDVKRDAPANAKAEPAPKPAEPAAAAPAPEPAPTRDEPSEPGPGDAGQLTFSVFVQSMAQQALMQLGMYPHPVTGQRQVSLEGARDTIDVLELMQVKTKGNLDAQEKQLLDGLLYELRMAWTELNNQLANMAKQEPGAPKP